MRRGHLLIKTKHILTLKVKLIVKTRGQQCCALRYSEGVLSPLAFAEWHLPVIESFKEWENGFSTPKHLLKI